MVTTEMDDETRRQVLGEVLMDELRVIREQTSEIPAIKRRLDTMGDDISQIKDDVHV